MTDRPQRRIIRTCKEFREKFNLLEQGDCLVGQLNLKRCEEAVFVDLIQRGVILIPSALSQQLARSKCLQALVYSRYMPEGTMVIRCRQDLVKVMETYARMETGPVITKQDRLDCGLGINRWNSIEDVFNMYSFGNLDFPFVAQPFIENARDVRVIILGEHYSEAYWRKNKWSFRNNLHFGGESGTFSLSEKQEKLCRKIMDRGRFPYAHIDLMLTPDGSCYMSEINLRGGIKGAQISPRRYMEIVNTIHEEFIRDLQSPA